MKITKILSAAAATVFAASAFAVTASAEYPIYDDVQPWIDQSASNYLIILYSDPKDSKDDVKPTYYGIDVSEIAQLDSVTFTFTVDDTWGMADYDYGGCIGTSAHECVNNPGGSDLYSKYNWVTYEYYGFVDEDLGIDTQDPDKALQSVKVGENTYSVSSKLVNAVAAGDLDELTSFRVFFADWGIMSETTVTQTDFYDAAGNLVLSMDGKGNILSTTFDLSDSSDSEAPAADTDTTASDTDTTAPVVDKTSPDTGVEGVAAVAALGVVAAGAIALSRKRK